MFYVFLNVLTKFFMTWGTKLFVIKVRLDYHGLIFS